MSRNICRICDDRLADYVNGKLDNEEVRTLRVHLEGSPPCAERERVLRMLFAETLPRSPFPERLPDAGSFLAGVNAGIDRKLGARAWWVPASLRPFRPALAASLIATLMIVAAGVAYLSLSGRETTRGDLFSGLLTAEDVSGLERGVDVAPLLGEITVSGLDPVVDTRFDDLTVNGGLAGLSDEMNLTLLEDVPYSAVVSASLEYISPLDAAEALDEDELEQMIGTLKNHQFTL
ncbi:MAG: zf-HC2 domain-containing protein [Bacteroidetes bacterium]|nr:zf-HC2 domain-containing protein [Bacteroidota bacterium]